MTSEDFEMLRSLLRERSGLALANDKAYLLESRLAPLARKRGLNGLDDLLEQVRGNSDEPLLRDVTEAMTTNESFFFRDQRPFEQFTDVVLPAMIQARAKTKTIRIWCAAASSGQEPYSLAICLKEQAQELAGWRIEIVGTDLSREILEKARAGIYSQFEIQRGLPIQYLVKYFEKVGEMWQVKSDLRAMVEYREHNLLDRYSSMGAFDIVFCRNVLIYFDPPTKADVLARIGQQMPKDNFLYLGGAETVVGVSDAFVPLAGQRGLYVLASQNQH